MENEKFVALEAKIQREYGNTAGITVSQEGTIVYEKYFNGCEADTAVHIFSVTKSIVSALIGIALEKGYITSLDQKVLDFFPEYSFPKKEKMLSAITLRHLLTMTVPYKRMLNPYPQYFTSPDWVKFSLEAIGGRGRVGEFKYAPLIGPDILSGILVKATGQSVLDFARENLFDPMGIQMEETITFRDKEEQMAFYQTTGVRGWVAGPTGVHTAGWGLSLTARELAKIGQLYLNGGVWEGQQLVPEKWIKESTREQSAWKKLGLKYGYLWWALDDERSFAALGDGGNTIYVNPQKQLVVSMTGLFMSEAKDWLALIQQEITAMF
ncbi:serine hydrolase [Enterococcus sp. 669A]|uniref:Serine hydrolase n=1 Tax=Candidatus Enterococcus moelleringii TaxID=2815325 RepID=A0ABS3L7S3_9ENTE|nr:serine hydrolase [Enterococcus sp. 669A]MBO1305660.1 serine hydrolase [Enterococcus sp. 669A]